MVKKLTDDINARHEIVSRMIFQAEEKLKTFPDGNIKIRHIGSKAYYYLTGADNLSGEKMLTDKTLIDALIQKRYITKVLSAARIESAYLQKVIKGYPEPVAENIYELLKDDRKASVRPIVLTDEQFVSKWKNTPYSKKPFSNDIPSFITLNGEKVRSKSELIIADRLYNSGIPYRYECALRISKDGRILTIHPDFTILRISDRKIVYLEHCGKMDDPEYAEKHVVKRINLYSHAGITVGGGLFLTFESSETPLDINVLDRLINDHFR